MTKQREMYGLPGPLLRWDEAGVPHSREYQDRYYSADGGPEESEYVFLLGNDLPRAWENKSHFVVCELGFGTGLNFLLTAELWRKSSSPGARLWFVSVESSPMSRDQTARSLAPWNLPPADVARLVGSLPLPIAGTHVLHFPGGVTLQLLYGEAEEVLPELGARVDAWFLDGFAPTRNPAMWSEPVCDEIRRLSVRGATFSTFSASSEIRRRLEARGFIVEKRKGFGKKREMLFGRCETSDAPARTELRRGKAVIIGGGLAGAASANSFLRRGWDVALVERERSLGARASGNPAGVLMPHLSRTPDLMSRFYVSGFEYTLRALACLRESGAPIQGENCGVLRLTSSERLERVFERLPQLGLPDSFVRALSKAEAGELAGFAVAAGALYFPEGGWVSPPDLCRALAADIRATTFSTEVAGFDCRGGEWIATAESGSPIESGDTLVFCGGYDAAAFEQTSWFPLEKVRGQAMSVDATEESRRLSHVLCYDGYISPAEGGRHFLGATYDHENDSTEIEEEQNRKLFSRLEQWVPGLPLRYRGSETSRVSFRTMSRDRLPLCGPVPDLRALESAGQPIFRKRWENTGLLPGLYANTGHGSRGLISCLSGAEIVAAHATGEPMPLELSLLQALFPARFPVRLILQGKQLDGETLGSLKVPHLRS